MSFEFILSATVYLTKVSVFNMSSSEESFMDYKTEFIDNRVWHDRDEMLKHFRALSTQKYTSFPIIILYSLVNLVITIFYIVLFV